MLCCRNKMIPFSAWTSSRTSLSVSNSLVPLIHRLGNRAASHHLLQSQGPVFHTTHCPQSSTSVPRHTYSAFNSPVLLKISLLPSLPLLSCLSFYWFVTETPPSTGALAPHCNCKDYLIEHPFLTLVSFLLLAQFFFPDFSWPFPSSLAQSQLWY